jgi:hypothetical protein
MSRSLLDRNDTAAAAADEGQQSKGTEHDFTVVI